MTPDEFEVEIMENREFREKWIESPKRMYEYVEFLE
jgi:hypothetical protein